MQSYIDRRVIRRVLPEIAKSFAVSPSYREDYRIACYDSAERGGLKGHRDNPTQERRHRQFTISVNLNAGEYEGGALRFREYGDQLYGLLAEVASGGPAVLVATHNERLAGLAGTVLILDAGRTYRRDEPA